MGMRIRRMMPSRMMPSIVIAVLLATGAPAAAPPSITAADIEKATHLEGVHLVTLTARGAVSARENFADSSGRIVLWFQTMNRTGFTRAKAQPAKTMSGIQVEPKLYHAAVAGLGDEAFDSPDGKRQHALYVRKRDMAFGVISNVDASGKPFVTMDQLKAIATIVLSRM
jgi:hypothetical protein